MLTRDVGLRGKTYRMDTPAGTAFVTVNRSSGEPFEVFVTVGKSGSEISAVSEAMGRLISYCLRITDETREERFVGIMAQLKDIGGGRVAFHGEDEVFSLADGVARALAIDMDMWSEENETA